MRCWLGTQSRFLLGNSTTEEEKHRPPFAHPYEWWVPITHASPGTGGFDVTYAKTWLRPGGGPQKVSGMPNRDTPVVFNVQQTGENDNNPTNIASVNLVTGCSMGFFSHYIPTPALAY